MSQLTKIYAAHNELLTATGSRIKYGPYNMVICIGFASDSWAMQCDTLRTPKTWAKSELGQKISTQISQI